MNRPTDQQLQTLEDAAVALVEGLTVGDGLTVLSCAYARVILCQVEQLPDTERLISINQALSALALIITKSLANPSGEATPHE